nr:DUF998 domain-containing protein [Actinomycetota bacterium]
MLTLPAARGGDFSARRDAISSGVHGRFGYLQAIAFYLLGACSLVFAAAVWDELPGPLGVTAAILLALWDMGGILCGLWPIDAEGAPTTWAGRAHLTAAISAFVFVLAGMFFATFAFRAKDSSSFWPVSFGFAIAALVAFLVSGVAQQRTSWGGLAQRVFIVVVLGWMMVAAVQT